MTPRDVTTANGATRACIICRPIGRTEYARYLGEDEKIACNEN